jgi:hypothetical protein
MVGMRIAGDSLSVVHCKYTIRMEIFHPFFRVAPGRGVQTEADRWGRNAANPALHLALFIFSFRF